VERIRVIVGWLSFLLLIALSINALIEEGTLTLKVWIYLLLTPAALALGMTRNPWWEKETPQASELVEEDEVEVSLSKEAPDPIEDGFDIPVL
tara:strand:+ start:5459 stop:5737 length:279 start_codon:yes stop_codon:yes gene_type:complete